MTSPDLIARLRPRLEDKLHSVAARHAKIAAHLTNSDRSLPQDWSELAQVLENDEVLEALDGHDREELSAIRLALRRMDAGGYGVCASCGEDIAPGRLEALPLVMTCIRCASAAAS